MQNSPRARLVDRRIWVPVGTFAIGVSGATIANVASAPVTQFMDVGHQRDLRQQILADQCVKDWVDLGAGRTIGRTLVRTEIGKRKVPRLGYWRHHRSKRIEGEDELVKVMELFGRCGGYLSQKLMVRENLTDSFLEDAELWRVDLETLRAKYSPTFDAEWQSMLEYSIAGLRDLLAERTLWMPVEFQADETRIVSPGVARFCGLAINRNSTSCSTPALCVNLEDEYGMPIGHWLIWSKNVRLGAMSRVWVEGEVRLEAAGVLKPARFAQSRTDFSVFASHDYPAP
jgi:hypothetical protein